MIICTKCNKKFKNQQDLVPLVSYKDGTVENLIPGKVMRPGGESFFGCPNCLTELFLKII